jgi:hypothetical protein
MDRTERIKAFAELVTVTDKLTRKWELALLANNALWIAVLFILLRKHQDK